MAKADTVTLCPETDMKDFTKEMSEQEKELWVGTADVKGFSKADISDLIHKRPKEQIIEERLDSIDQTLSEMKIELRNLRGKVEEMTPPKIKGIKNLIITKESLDEIWDEEDDTL